MEPVRHPSLFQTNTRGRLTERARTPGHLQRGGAPMTFDRVLCPMFGAMAMELAANGEFGKMVALTGEKIGTVDIAESVGRLKTVRLDGNMAGTARAPGICPGD